ncbi:transient receptor potential cation channel subfamily A member 1 homolog [Paramuricea clavata]|uniref:Transient receptor potential cation channel subfamily A member 1 homolog n=1 Tax=Paramuricea clavata TaxID=317549 RepID=A0A6S7J856_PARCT|nr:transient receptor potential cation channel subfamily A member 1 homolog [Paramuricea clavata]
MLKTTMGMLGEYEYDTVYNESDVPPITWAVYVCFLVINCVIIVNLLIGLAVDDIKGVQDKAALKRLAMQVDLALDVEKVLPLFLRKKLVTMTETVYPNRERYRGIWSFWRQTLASPAQVINDALYPAKSPIERIQKQQEVLQYDVTKMKTRLKTLQTRTVRLEAMLKAILSHHGIDVKPEIDEDDAELKWNPSDDEADRYIAG